jgi:rhodanese-related sulfurtransferase
VCGISICSTPTQTHTRARAHAQTYTLQSPRSQTHTDTHLPRPQVTAIQIASLKRLGRGSKVLLLDRTGSTAKTVAKELSKRGFGRVYVIDGGFDGRNGWVGSKLLVKPDAGAGLQPLPNITRTITSRRGLPAPSK